MKVEKININKTLIFFLIVHVTIWTLVPSISNYNLPLDTIEALAWASNLDWGYNKHPPLSAWSVEVFYQIFVALAFFIVFKFYEDFFKNKIISLIYVLLLEGIFFYNFTTPEFNVNVCQLPFWALTVYYCWKGIKQNDNISWLLFGIFAALGILSKYLFIYLLLALDIFFIYLIVYKKLNFKCLVSLISFFVIIFSHLIWLMDNNYTTITYALSRTGVEDLNPLEAHLFQPFIFIIKQIGILMPFFLMIFFVVSKFNIKLNFKDKKLLFLLTINIIPIILMFLTSIFMGIKVRTMWMTPFYLFMGVLFLYVFQKKIVFKKLKYFFSIFLILFIFSPLIYLYISIIQTDKRTDYPGKKISQIVQKKWDDNFINKIGLVGGDEWHGGNLSYHLKSRPRWDNIFSKKISKTISSEDGFVLIGDPEILLKICSEVFFKVENQGICMAGKHK